MKSKILVVIAAIVATVVVGAPLVEAAVPTPTTANGFTQAFADKNDMVWSGGDQMTSFKAPNGKVYWSVGDTMLSNGEDPDGSYPDVGTTMIGNRLLLQTGGEFVNAMADNGMAVPDPATATPENQERYWAGGMFYAGSHLYVLCQRVVKDADPNSIGFKLAGIDMAKYSINSAGKLTLVSMVVTPSSGVMGGVGPTAIQWGGDAIVQGGYAYVYGFTGTSGNPYVIHYTYVARVPVAQVELPSAWRYYKKTTNQWVNNIASLNTDPVNQPDAIVPSQVSSVRVISNKIVLLHKPWNGYGTAVYAEVSTNPQGTFTQKHLFDAPAGTWEGKNYTTYGPMLHPEQTLKGAETGKILVSIDWNGVDFWTDVLGNADLYKPRFQAVTLP